MVKKKTSSKKKTTDQLRKEAVAEIDVRLNGDAKPTNPRKGGKATKTASKKSTKTENAPKEKQARKPSGLDFAALVLADSKEPLNAKTIAERAIASGWKTNGKTPHATIYAAIIREISQKGKDARFEKVDRGQFKLRG